jgi:hypothetical protein
MFTSPYPAARDIQPEEVLCETCNFALRSQDWAAHKAGKKHRGRETELRARAEQQRYFIISVYQLSLILDRLTTCIAKKPMPISMVMVMDRVTKTRTPLRSSSAILVAANVERRVILHTNVPSPVEQDALTVERPVHIFTKNLHTESADPQKGHRASDCTEARKPRPMTCHNCGQEGHKSVDCQAPRKPRDYSKMKCHNCQECKLSRTRIMERIYEFNLLNFARSTQDFCDFQFDVT